VCKGSETPWAGTAYSSHAVSGGFSSGSTIIKYSGCSTTASGVWTTETSKGEFPFYITIIA
jgi:hypothetical protein